MKKSSAQLDREIADVLAKRAAERRTPTTASGVVKKLLGKARRLLTKQRADLTLRDPTRMVEQLSAIAAEAVEAAELELAAARLPTGYADIWASRFEDHVARARDRIAELRMLRMDPEGYAQVSPQRFGPEVSTELATMLHYVTALDGLQSALRRIEAMTESSRCR